MRDPALIDAALEAPALVHGSLPPDGRDLDLLVQPGHQLTVEDRLIAAGFLRRGDVWARFAGCSVDVVELTGAAAWGLPADELQALFAEAVGIDGFANLRRPSPQHTLLILARRLAGEGDQLAVRRRGRVAAALAEDPGAWERARARSPAWDARDALDRLQQLHEQPRAAREPAPAGRRGFRRGGAVIALSGLDGAGKSTQAIALRDTLDRLGYDVTIAWTRIIWDDALWRVAMPVKAALEVPLRLVGALRRSGAGDGSGETAAVEDPVKRARERSALATHAWTMVIALTNAISQRRLTRPVLRRGGVVICDRYTLDSIVALRFAYGPHLRFGLQRRLIQALSPRPRRAYLLDVPPEIAYRRKAEGGIDWLAGHRRLYRQEHVELGVRLIDGERPLEEICAEIAADVWQSGL